MKLGWELVKLSSAEQLFSPDPSGGKAASHMVEIPHRHCVSPCHTATLLG